ncbi:PREDICTED: heat shock transcription factor, Y-linked-like [Rhinopithecus bieti]|uniref:heat shock transcription factor, Y-linked-like n=1 Tax=Rhinopithecus bieti TaxID=61621 RepID=UPI00083C4FB7|nr:PREDICTED: heat shock transcription factor, Y-linked-like [Rhinopithecus bieti]
MAHSAQGTLSVWWSKLYLPWTGPDSTSRHQEDFTEWKGARVDPLKSRLVAPHLGPEHSDLWTLTIAVTGMRVSDGESVTSESTLSARIQKQQIDLQYYFHTAKNISLAQLAREIVAFQKELQKTSSAITAEHEEFENHRPALQNNCQIQLLLPCQKLVPYAVELTAQCYYNPNFKRGFPQLLVRVQRIIDIKNASLTPTLFHEDFNQRHFREGANMENHNPALPAEVSAESLFSTSTNLNMSLTRESSVGKIIASSFDPVISGFPPPSRSTSIGPSEQSATDQHAILNQLSAIHMHPHSTYMQARGHIVNFITTITSQYHIISPFQNCFLQLIVESPAVPTRYTVASVNQAPHPNLLPAGHRWLQMSMIADISSSTLSRPATQPSPLDKYHTSYN